MTMRTLVLLSFGLLAAACADAPESEIGAADELAIDGGVSPEPGIRSAGGKPGGNAGAVRPRRFTLPEVRARVLERANLDLAAAAIRADEARGRVTEAGLWPNPSLLVRQRRVDDLDLFSSGFLEVEVGQPIELGGKRGARVERAGAELAAVDEEVRALAASTLRDAESGFFRALRLERELAEAREEARTTAELEALAVSRFEAGKDTRIARLRFEAAAADARLAVRDLERRHAEACRALDELLGAPAGTVAGVDGALEAGVLGAGERERAQDALAGHPRLRAAEMRATAADRAVDSATAGAWPDFTVGLAYERDHDLNENFLGLLFQLPLPLLNRNQGVREEAQAAARRARKTLEAEALRTRVELEAAFLAYDRANENVAGYARDIIPRLETSLELTRAAYAAGKASYLDVLDAHLSLIRSRRARLGHEEARALAAVEIRYLASGTGER